MDRSQSDPKASAGLAFLLSQVGAHSAAKFAERLEPLNLKPAHVGILTVIADADGISQQALAERLGVFASRLVALIDELAEKGLVERRNRPVDRRSYALFLTETGQTTLQTVSAIAREHQASICMALSDEEQGQLAELLRTIARDQGLAPGVHPGFRLLGRETKS